eukprot:1652367-Rhodomonas_salina.3
MDRTAAEPEPDGVRESSGASFDCPGVLPSGLAGLEEEVCSSGPPLPVGEGSKLRFDLIPAFARRRTGSPVLRRLEYPIEGRKGTLRFTPKWTRTQSNAISL